jgi:hypothetical protein
LWTGQQYRPTRDADFLARGENSPERFFRIFRELCSVETEPDGVRFDPDTVSAERIADAADYEGVRVNLRIPRTRENPDSDRYRFWRCCHATSGRKQLSHTARINSSSFAHLSSGDGCRGKLEAMVNLGIANSRMKDFYDMEVLSRTFSFSGKSLREAIHNTFERRGTELPLDGTPLAFTIDFYEDVNKIRQWIAFSEENRSYVEPIEFKTLVAHIAKFLVPVTSAARRNVSFTKTWKAGGPWS